VRSATAPRVRSRGCTYGLLVFIMASLNVASAIPRGTAATTP
jgi:hypothetical protein